MEKVAYNSGRRAFIKGYTVCIFKRPADRASWNRGFQDEQDELETLAKSLIRLSGMVRACRYTASAEQRGIAPPDKGE